MRRLLLLTTLLSFVFSCNSGFAGGKLENTPYSAPKTVYDFYFDHPQHINSALYWLRAQITPLMEDPYNFQPEDMKIVVIIHGTEIASVVTQNYKKYQTAVDRMRYYASLGVEFRVCGLAATDYGYSANDFQDFIKLVPSAMADLSYWQQQGYGLITPRILIKQHSIESIR